MKTSSLESKRGTVDTDFSGFENFSALHALNIAFRELDTRSREEIQETLGRFKLPPYTAPEGHIIVVEPNHPRSREVGLTIERFDPRYSTWVGTSPHSSEFHQAVSFRGEFDQYFIGHRLEQDEGTIYAVNPNIQSRAQIGHHAIFRLAELEGSM